MQLQRFPLLLALSLVTSLSACISPNGRPGEEPFKDEKLAFIEIGKTTKEEIATAMSDFAMTPQKYRGGDWWLYAQTRKERQFLIGTEVFGDVDYRFLLIKFDNNGIVAGYESSRSEGYGCNRYGVCVHGSSHTLLASKDEDRVVKQFDIPADRCGVYVYGKPKNSAPVRIWLDGHRVGRLLNKKHFLFWQLDQGDHQLAPHSPDVANQSPIEFSCAGGDLYFFEVKGKSKGFFHIRFWTEIEQPDAVTGRNAIAKRRLTLNYTEPSDPFALLASESAADPFQSYATGENSAARRYYHGLEKRGGRFFKVDATVPYTGQHKTLYADGRRAAERNFSDGLEHGLFTTWYIDGTKETEQHFQSGKLSGPRIVWFQNGQKYTLDHYKDNRRHGLSTYWNRDGTVSSQMCFQNGEYAGVTPENCTP